MAHHYLKTEIEFFMDIEMGKKKFELRKNDRDFTVYDVVTLEESRHGELTGRKTGPMQIQYVFKDARYGLKKGYCIFCW